MYCPNNPDKKTSITLKMKTFIFTEEIDACGLCDKVKFLILNVTLDWRVRESVLSALELEEAQTLLEPLKAAMASLSQASS